MINQNDIIIGNILYNIDWQCLVKIVMIHDNKFGIHWYKQNKIYCWYDIEDFTHFRNLTDVEKLELC